MPYSSLQPALRTCTIVCAFFALALPLSAQTNPLFEKATEFRNRESGLRLLVPNQWIVSNPVTDRITKKTLQGPEAQYIYLYPRADKGSRLTAYVSVYVSNIEGVFGLPARLRGKLSDADLLNWHIDRLARTSNAFKVLDVRRGRHLGMASLVVEYKSKSHDHYNEITTERFVFKGDTVYQITSSHLASRTENKTALEDIISEIRILTEGEKRYIAQ